MSIVINLLIHLKSLFLQSFLMTTHCCLLLSVHLLVCLILCHYYSLFLLSFLFVSLLAIFFTFFFPYFFFWCHALNTSLFISSIFSSSSLHPHLLFILSTCLDFYSVLLFISSLPPLVLQQQHKENNLDTFLPLLSSSYSLLSQESILSSFQSLFIFLASCAWSPLPFFILSQFIFVSVLFGMCMSFMWLKVCLNEREVWCTVFFNLLILAKGLLVAFVHRSVGQHLFPSSSSSFYFQVSLF